MNITAMHQDLDQGQGKDTTPPPTTEQVTEVEQDADQYHHAGSLNIGDEACIFDSLTLMRVETNAVEQDQDFN